MPKYVLYDLTVLLKMRLGERKIHANLDRSVGSLLLSSWQDLQQAYQLYLRNLGALCGVTRVDAWKILYRSSRQAWPKLNSKQLQYARDAACRNHPPQFCPITLDHQSFSLCYDAQNPKIANMLFWRNNVHIFGKSLKALHQAKRIRLIEIYLNDQSIWKVTLTYDITRKKAQPGQLVGLYLDNKTIALSSGQVWSLNSNDDKRLVENLGCAARDVVSWLAKERTERVIIAALNRKEDCLQDRCSAQSITLRALVKRCEEVGVIISFTEPLASSKMCGACGKNEYVDNRCLACGSKLQPVINSAQAILARHARPGQLAGDRA